MTPRTAVVALAFAATACSAPLMKLPSGPGAPAPDAAAAWSQATRACRAVRTLTAEIAVSGSVGGRRLRGRLSAGVARPASARLEALAPFGPPIFIFVARRDDATLLLPRDSRVLEHGTPSALLDAAAGVPLDGADLTALLTGCPADAAVGEARRFGDVWLAVVIGRDEVYLHRDNASAPWSVAASVRREGARERWREEFRDLQNGLPRTIRVMSLEKSGADGAGFDLRLALSQVEIDVSLGDDAFTVVVPAGAQPISLDELRRTGPLGSGASDER
jgi:hypothetical protein